MKILIAVLLGLLVLSSAIACTPPPATPLAGSSWA